MPTDTRFRDYSPNQDFLLPPTCGSGCPDHLANFISDVVDELDLSAIIDVL